MSLVLGLGLECSCPWPREVLSSKRLSLALALASDFFCVLGLGLEPCVLDSTSALYDHVSYFEFIEKHWNRWVDLQLIYPNKYLWWLETKEKLRELLINLSKCKSSIEKDEISELEQKLQQLAAALSFGKKVFTEFKHVVRSELKLAVQTPHINLKRAHTNC